MLISCRDALLTLLFITYQHLKYWLKMEVLMLYIVQEHLKACSFANFLFKYFI